jgi:hypothetical protein
MSPPLLLLPTMQLARSSRRRRRRAGSGLEFEDDYDHDNVATVTPHSLGVRRMMILGNFGCSVK